MISPTLNLALVALKFLVYEIRDFDAQLNALEGNLYEGVMQWAIE